MAEESPSLLSSMREMVKEEIQCSLRSLQSHSDLPSTSSANIRESSSDEDAGPDSDFSSSDESTSHQTFHPDEVDHLLKAISATMVLEEPKEGKVCSRPIPAMTIFGDPDRFKGTKIYFLPPPLPPLLRLFFPYLPTPIHS